MKRNLDLTSHLYHPGQARQHFIPYLKFTPEWFIELGPGSAVEFLEVREKWPEVKLLGLEPSPVGYQAAKARWPADGILLQVAGWECDGLIRLFHPGDLLHSLCYYDGPHVLDDDPLALDNKLEDSVLIPARSLDSLDKEYGPFKNAVLWMDIEGSERRVLKGAAKLLKRGAIRAVNVEVRPQYAKVIGDLLKAGDLQKVREYFACETVRDEVWTREGP